MLVYFTGLCLLHCTWYKCMHEGGGERIIFIAATSTTLSHSRGCYSLLVGSYCVQSCSPLKFSASVAVGQAHHKHHAALDWATKSYLLWTPCVQSCNGSDPQFFTVQCTRGLVGRCTTKPNQYFMSGNIKVILDPPPTTTPPPPPIILY